MRLIPNRADAPPSQPRQNGVRRELSNALLGLDGALPLPAITDLLSAGLALATAKRKKSLLPHVSAPAELVLVRHGDELLVSYYRIDDSPEVLVLNRAIQIRDFLTLTAHAANELGALSSDPGHRELTLRLAERARQAPIVVERSLARPILKRGGALSVPSVPLAFGFEAAITPSHGAPRQTTAHSDMHAMLFSGRLFLWARQRDIGCIFEGPIMLAVSRMVTAVRALIEAHEQRRPLHVRLRAGSFLVGVRLGVGPTATAQLSFASDHTPRTCVPKLSVAEASLPVLRLASELLRALVTVDRGQARNLRVTSLRDEVRALRRRIRDVEPDADSIVHEDPEQLRASAVPSQPDPSTPRSTRSPRVLRFEAKWEADIEGLDAGSTYLCGDRIVIATPRHTVALARDTAEVLWAREQSAAASFMAGTVLVRLAANGELALVDVADGEPFATSRIAPRVGGPPLGVLAGGRTVPPVAVLAEHQRRLVAVDLRTGQLRWRYTATRPGAFRLRKAGRILLATNGGSTVSALDVANGELLWRFAKSESRFRVAPTVRGDVVIAVDQTSLYAIDLYSGRPLFTGTLRGLPTSAPIVTEELAAVAVRSRHGAQLVAYELDSGRERFRVADPGAGDGAAFLAVDRSLLINAPDGRLTALSVDDGSVRWDRTLAHPVADDVPRSLEPVLRGGALFVPSAAVHVLRPADGSSVGDPLPCELIPDWIRVDERGWVYIAEESGQLTAFAPRPHLELVR